MTQQGRGGAALAIAAIGSFVAGTLSVVGLMVLAPPLAEFAIRFGPAEYTSLLVVGLIVLAYMSGGSMLKMLAMAALGLLCGMVGMDVMSGYARFTGGVIELRDGLGIVPVAVGLFGISEIMLSAARAREVAVRQPRLAELVPTRAELGAAVAPIARGSVLGFLIGIIPGSAHIISSFVSYGIERRVSKTPERFGHGAVAGVAGPESANNAAASGAFVPMLALGVPSGPIPAVMLAAIMIHGVVPGPLLIAERPEIFWGFIASMYIGNVVLLILNLPLVGLFIQVLRIPYRYLYPLILTLCVLGVYAVGQSVVDVWIMIVMGLVGYAMRKLGYEPAPLVLGMVIAPQLELSFRQALALSGGSYSIFVTRPVSAVLLALAVVLLALSLRSALTQHADWRRQLGLEERV
jgi:putative tricarboxylic transport membrane protein